MSRIKLVGEVFTPSNLVDEMLVGLPKNVWTDPTKTWLEPSCGNGNFLEAIHAKLMVGLTEWQMDDQARHQHIIERMLFGLDIMQDNVDACIIRLKATKLRHHIVCADSLAYHYRFDEWDNDAEPALFIW